MLHKIGLFRNGGEIDARLIWSDESCFPNYRETSVELSLETKVLFDWSADGGALIVSIFQFDWPKSGHVIFYKFEYYVLS